MSTNRNPSVQSNGKAAAVASPGSNGYWRREVYDRPGTRTWTASKDGTVKIQALGAASGAAGNIPGSSGAFGQKVLAVKKGDVLTIVTGTGGDGVASAGTAPVAGSGSSTSISGTPVGGTPLVLVGAQGPDGIATTSTGAPGSATGPWDVAFPGEKANGTGRGAPSSASPFGPGNRSTGTGGAGWGGGSSSNFGASSHRPADTFASRPPIGFLAKTGTGGSSDPDGESRPFWDLCDVDGAGGWPSGAGGVGAGCGESSYRISPLGGGGSFTNAATTPPKPGFGAGGAAVSTGNLAGSGGDAYVMLFWDEVL